MTTKDPRSIVEPSENGSRIEIRCKEQIDATMRYFGIHRNPLPVLYLIVCLDDDGECVELWSVELGSWDAKLLFNRAEVTA